MLHLHSGVSEDYWPI